MNATRVMSSHGPADPWPASSRLVGTVLTLPGAVTAELLAEPFDLVWIDLEHGALGRGEAQDMILGAQAAGALAFVRLAMPDADGLVGAMLDAGADGIVAADVRGPSQAAWLVGLDALPAARLPRLRSAASNTSSPPARPAPRPAPVVGPGREPGGRPGRRGDRANSGCRRARRRNRRSVLRPWNPGRPHRPPVAQRVASSA